MLHFGVNLGAEENDDSSDPKPRHKSDDGAERAVGLVELAEIGGVPGKQAGYREPEQGGDCASPRDPAPSRSRGSSRNGR